MAGGFIRKLWGRSPAVSPEVAEALGDVDRLARERPALAGLAVFHRDLLLGLYEVPVQEPALSLAPAHAAAKVGGGLPLLRGESVPLDAAALLRRWRRACGALRHCAERQAAATALAEAPRRGVLDLGELAREVLAGRAAALPARIEALGLDAGLAAFFLRVALLPVLARFRIDLAPLLAGARWERGDCPTCGSWPLLGEFRGLGQARFLRCGLCAGEWECPRLFCPFCGTRDHHQLGYFHVEGEEAKHRAATCAGCGGYVKLVTTLTALSGPRLLVADLATFHLDLAAAERGYAGPAFR